MAHWLERLLGDTQAKLLRLLRRSRQTITALARSLRLTDNAVRTHVAELTRHGFVADVGVHRETGGKPARVYGLTPAGEELFPKAYALVLGELLAHIARARDRKQADALIAAAGRQIASHASPRLDAAASAEQRVQAAAAVLRQLGADLDVRRTGHGWRLQGYGCPLSALTAEHPELCRLIQAIVSAIAERPVRECCDRSEQLPPRCAFAVS